jgi:hypothetical protein
MAIPRTPPAQRHAENRVIGVGRSVTQSGSKLAVQKARSNATCCSAASKTDRDPFKPVQTAMDRSRVAGTVIPGKPSSLFPVTRLPTRISVLI